MTNLYEMQLTVLIKVEARNVREARTEATKLANEVQSALPVGASLDRQPSALPINLI